MSSKMTSRQLSDYSLSRSLSMGDLRAHDESVIQNYLL